MKIIDIKGKKFGRLKTIRITNIKDNKKGYSWEFLCDCGNIVIRNGTSVRNGTTQSCGCLQKERYLEAKQTHGMTKTRTYKIWSQIKNRCLNKNNQYYHRYGGRGITISSDWLIFENFLKDIGEIPHKLSIDRIDNNGNYCKDNCRLVSMKIQQNNRSSNKVITYDGKTKTMSEWSDFIGINYKTLKARIRNGWKLERALQPFSRQHTQTIR